MTDSAPTGKASPPRRRPTKAETEQKYAAAAAQAQERWAAASAARVDHPYLRRKGITDAAGLRQEAGTLLVPMKGLERAEGGSYPILSLQTIGPDGEKRFMAGGRSVKVRTTVGLEHVRRSGTELEPGQTFYLCEGWATGWTIAHVMKAPVFVAFSANNLKHVADYMKKAYAEMDLVLAADNDRFSDTNPGVTLARKALYTPFGEVAIPDFKEPGTSKEDGKTDFNDLWLAEGAQSVRFWINPARAGSAKITPPDPEPEPVPEDIEQGGSPEGWYATKPFRLLGHDRGLYYYLPQGAGQIVGLLPEKHERVANLVRLAPLAWWEGHFPGRGQAPVDTRIATDALIQTSHRVGIFRPDNVRGRGCWQEEAEDDDPSTVVLHLGDRMVVPGATKYVKPEDYESPGGYMYEHQPRMRGPGKTPLDLETTRELLDIFRSFLWRDPAAGDLLAGWTFLAPIGGALAWRPHVWLTGERGSGKSTVIKSVVMPLLGGSSEVGGMGLNVVGETSEAGIRQTLRADAFPVVFDEAEEGEGVGARIQKVLGLARQASSDSDARTLKGTTHGSSIQFRVRSMFCFASIGGAVYQEADKSRICMLTMRGSSQIETDFKLRHWESLAPRLVGIDDTTGRRMLTRALGLLRGGTLLDTIQVFRRAGGRVFGDQRTGDQYGTLYAGSWLLQSNDVPTESEAVDALTAEDVRTHQDEQVPEGRKALQILLQQRERVDTEKGVKTVAVGQLLDACAGGINGAQVTEGEAAAVLNQIGMRVQAYADGYQLLLAPRSEWVASTLSGTMYARGLRNVVQPLEGVGYSDRPVRFHRGLVQRALVIPYSLLTEHES